MTDIFVLLSCPLSLLKLSSERILVAIYRTTYVPTFHGFKILTFDHSTTDRSTVTTVPLVSVGIKFVWFKACTRRQFSHNQTETQTGRRCGSLATDDRHLEAIMKTEVDRTTETSSVKTIPSLTLAI